MNPFEVVATIIGLFFAVGILVGILLVTSIPWGGRGRKDISGDTARRLQGYQTDPSEQLGTGPPAEPDDRDDYPWWANGR